jgi:hypothetical protein
VSDEASGTDGGAGDADGWEGTDEPTTGSTPRVEEPVPHSRLVGLMAVPISRSVPIRRSTALMLVAFLGFGTLGYLYPPKTSTTSGTGTSGSTGNGVIPGVFIPATSTTTTHPNAVTTTTRPGAATTTTSTSTSSTTTTTRPPTTTTSTRPVGSTTTTTTRIGATTTTQPGSTTTTTGSVP